MAPWLWWTDVIHNNSATPHGRPDSKHPPRAASDLPATSKSLKTYSHQNQIDKVVVGIVSSSDTSPLPATTSRLGRLPPLLYDIDFCCLSYDVAFSKPDARIFTAAETTASAILSQRGGALDHNLDPSHCIKVHVGDNYSEDVMGALSAGWNAVLVGSPAFTPGKTDFVLSEAHLPRRAYPGSDAVLMSTPISRVFSDDPARPPVSLRVPDIRTLRKWLMHTQPDEDSNEEGNS